VVYRLPPVSAGRPLPTRLEYDWAICLAGWAVWARWLVLRALAGAEGQRAARAHHGAPIARTLLVALAIASVLGHHMIGAALAHVP
jgi:hypothetical protein